jgi:hypothetical protein
LEQHSVRTRKPAPNLGVEAVEAARPAAVQIAQVLREPPGRACGS